MTTYQIKSLKTEEGINPRVGQRIYDTIPIREDGYIVRMLHLIPNALQKTLRGIERFLGENKTISDINTTVKL